jgi:nitrate reductase gamma subunit
MVLSFPNYVPVDIVHTVGLAIGIIVLVVVLFELVRWRGVLAPIAKASRLGVVKWWEIFVNTLAADVIYQQISTKCPDRKWFSHSLVFWGFLMLSASTALNYITNSAGGPLPLVDPVRILGNAGGVLLMAGLAIVVYRIIADSDKREVTLAPDYLFIGLLLLAGLTGFLSEYASEINAVAWIYGVYVVHLLSSAALLLLAPFTRFIHAFGRPIIRLSERYLEALNQHGIVIPSELTVMPLLSEGE